MEPINLAKIKEVTEEFFIKTELPIEVEVKDFEGQTIPINLKMEEPQILIGERGQTLAEIQRLIRLVLKKQVAPQEHFYINLDVNDYKKKKTEYLKEVARDIADEVSLTKKERSLLPMSSFERRVIHMELAQREDIVTESVGEDPERTIVVKPRP